jgi:gas vesicle protein
MSAAMIGAACGAAVGYLFFTDQGKAIRERFEPALDDLRQEFTKFQGTIEKVGALANDGMRVMEEFKAARGHYPTRTTSH